jgi:hypothetical protein
MPLVRPLRTLGILWEEVDSACGNVRFRKFIMCTIETDRTIKAEQLIDRITTEPVVYAHSFRLHNQFESAGSL